MTRASTPGSLSTSTAMVCFWIPTVLLTLGSLRGARRLGGRPLRLLDEDRDLEMAWAPLDEDHAVFRYRLARLLVLGPEQHLVVTRPRWDHREAVLRLIDLDVDDHGPVDADHLPDDTVDLVRPGGAQADRPEGLGELHEI